MRKIIGGILLAILLVAVFALAFNLYGQVAVDYSLDSLKQALESPPSDIPPEIGNGVYRSNLENLVLEEVTKRDADLKSLVLLETATRSIRDAIEDSGYAKADVYLSEVLREKTAERSPLLRIGDAVYYAARSFLRAIQNLMEYLTRKTHPAENQSSLKGAGVLLLGEAGRMEKSWNLEEAARYYREFLDRYPGRPESGFVTISLAHVLMKIGRLEDAERLLTQVKKDYPGGAEETAAARLLGRIGEINKQKSRVPFLEEEVRNDPGKLYTKEVGLELALIHLATYNVEPALSVLEKMQESPDPNLRSKALFYQGWIHKWQGDFEKGKEILELLAKQQGVGQDLRMATQASLADIYSEEKEYEKALEEYQRVPAQEQGPVIKSLSDLEQSGIYIFGLNRLEEVRDRIKNLEVSTPAISPFLVRAKARLEEALNMTIRDQAFVSLYEGRVPEAEKMFGNYLSQFPRDGLAHSGLASIYILQGNFNEALEAAQKGYGLTRDEYTASVIAYVYEKLGQTEEAGRYYSIASSIFPSYPVAKYNLARIYAATGKYEEADRLLSELEKLAKNQSSIVQAKILNNRGYVLWELRREKEAMASFREALKLRPDLSEAKNNLQLIESSSPNNLN